MPAGHWRTEGYCASPQNPAKCSMIERACRKPSRYETLELMDAISPAAVKVDRVTKRFGALEVLRGISLGARDGDVIAIIGSSGSGKSTLLRCINMLEVPDTRRGRDRRRGDHAEAAAGRRTRTPADRRQIDRIRSAARHGVPELQSLVPHDGARERHRGAGPRAEAAAAPRCVAEALRAARQGRHRRQARRLPGAALRRPAAARRHRPRARHATRR